MLRNTVLIYEIQFALGHLHVERAVEEVVAVLCCVLCCDVLQQNCEVADVWWDSVCA